MQAIVLSRRDFRENDQIITFYTQESGRREALARGVKKIVSKNTASLEPFSLLEIEIVPGKEIEHLTKVQVIEPFTKFQGDLKKMLIGGYCLGVVDKLVSHGEKDERLYEYLAEFLRFVNEVEMVNCVLIPAFILRLLGFLGFAPRLDRCVRCGELITISDKYIFDIASGGVVGVECLAKVRSDESVTTVTSNTRFLLQVLLGGSWEAINSSSPGEIETREIAGVVQKFTEFHASRHLPDWRRLTA